MRIGFDISQTGNNSKAGCGYYAQSLFSSLKKVEDAKKKIVALPSFGDFYFDQQFQTQINSKKHELFEYGPTHLNLKEASDYWNSEVLETSLNLDIIHSNNFWCPVGLSNIKIVYTLYDLGFLFNPQSWTTEINRIGCFEGVFRASLEADWIVAISDASKEHFLKIFPYFPEERIQTIYPSTRFSNFSEQTLQPNRFKGVIPQLFWLSVGTIEPRKNQLMLIHAYARYLASVCDPIPLVLAGGNGWMMEGFEDEIKKLGLSNHIIRVGYVSDEELIWLYQNCFANLYPSLFEGFGLPVLEGMQFGAPTITSNTSSLPEVAGAAGILLNPGDVDAWSKSMQSITFDDALKEGMRQAGLRQAEKFSWRKSARELSELYDLVYSSPKRLSL